MNYLKTLANLSKIVNECEKKLKSNIITKKIKFNIIIKQIDYASFN